LVAVTNTSSSCAWEMAGVTIAIAPTRPQAADTADTSGLRPRIEAESLGFIRLVMKWIPVVFLIIPTGADRTGRRVL
jgi:hypothetical protein